jgi:RNase adaptor protein for sRNA GlmZ degradation
MEPPGSRPLIGVVGHCGSGKSTLITGLENHGYACRHIAQEHSYVPYMWQVISKPDILVYLQVSFPVSTARRKLKWVLKDYEEQSHRLSQAHSHAHIIINTDELTPEQVLQKALDFLNEREP